MIISNSTVNTNIKKTKLILKIVNNNSNFKNRKKQKNIKNVTIIETNYLPNSEIVILWLFKFLVDSADFIMALKDLLL